MEQSIFIVLIVVTGLVLLLIVHSAIHKLLRFKMDESAIIRFMRNYDGGNQFECSEVISAGTRISIERVKNVCSRSKVIERKDENAEAWRLK